MSIYNPCLIFPSLIMIKTSCQDIINGARLNIKKPLLTREWEPDTTIEISDEDSEKLLIIVELLEEHDDVQDVYTNAT